MAVTLFTFWQEDTDRQFFRSPDFRKLKADLVLYGVKYRRDSRKKASQWVVRADTARFYEKKRECRFEGVKIVFMPHTADSVRISARQGRYDFDRGTLQVSGQVVVDGFKDYILYSEKLIYDPATMTIKAPCSVEMVDSSGSRLKGRYMIYYVNQSRLTLASPKAVISGGKTGMN